MPSKASTLELGFTGVARPRRCTALRGRIREKDDDACCALRACDIRSQGEREEDMMYRSLCLVKTIWVREGEGGCPSVHKGRLERGPPLLACLLACLRVRGR